MAKYERDDIYFCPDCRRFHDEETGKPVYVPGAPEYLEFNGKVYKVRNQPPGAKAKSSKSRGFGKI